MKRVYIFVGADRMQTTKGRGRGVLGLINCKTPLRRPKAFQIETSNINCDIETITSPEIKYTASWADCRSDSVDSFTPGQTLFVKYSYTANQDSPLGEELSVQQKDTVIFKEFCPENKMWCKVELGNKAGYVPADYVMKMETENDRLPWLKFPSEVPQEKVEYKPYKSAYAPRDEGRKETQPETSYRCDVCNKDFNGPRPYEMHMKSKAHKEEVEAQEG